jgi:hypothetical protein
MGDWDEPSSFGPEVDQGCVEWTVTAVTVRLPALERAGLKDPPTIRSLWPDLISAAGGRSATACRHQDEDGDTA